MDIPDIPQNLIKALEQKNTAQLTALSRVLDLVVGKTVMASVISVTEVTPQERQELLKQTINALAALNKQSINPANLTPAVKAEISRLMQQHNLIQSPELKWVNLTVNDRAVLTYTDRPLATGQSIPVQLQNGQRLVLLNMPDLNALNSLTQPKTAALVSTNTLTSNPLLDVNSTSQLVNSKNSLINNFLKIANTPLLTELTENTGAAKNVLSEKQLVGVESKANNLNSNEVKQIVANNLRQLLPQKDIPAVLYSAVNQWQQLSTTVKQRLVSPSVELALKSLAEQMRSPSQLSQPKILAQVIKDSGVLFESKLANAGNNASTSGIPNINSNIVKTLSREIKQDLKGALLNLLSKVTQDTGAEGKPPSSEQTQKILQHFGSFGAHSSLGGTNSKTDGLSNLGVLLQQLFTKPAKELSDKDLRTQLLVLLQQHTVHSLAKIQLQQLHSVNHDLESKDSSQPTSSWSFEIPVKHQNEVQQLHLRIDREWVDDKKENNKAGTSNKIKQWSVILRFDLPKLGEFCAQLAIVEDNVSATLWAERSNTFAYVNQQIDALRTQLENEGITVKQLQCLRGTPPQKPMTLSYSLIDIST